MKLRSIVIMYILLILVAFTGCGKKVANTVEPVNQPTNSETSSATPNETGTLQNALLGHWVTDKDTTQYYFSSDDNMVMLTKESTGSDLRQDFIFSIIESNNKDSMKIKITNPKTNTGHNKILKFSSDKKSLISTVDPDSVYKLTGIKPKSMPQIKWTYVDDKQKP